MIILGPGSGASPPRASAAQRTHRPVGRFIEQHGPQ
jgi:hypothetical protein